MQIEMSRKNEKENDVSASESQKQSEEVQEHPFVEGFKQQMLKAWLPIPTLTKTTVLFFIMTAIFLGIGIPMLILANNIVEYSVDYDQTCGVGTSNCNVTFQITQTMHSPVFVYYELKHFYQNHRLYANSINYNQLGGADLSVSDLQSSCSPIVTNGDVYLSNSITGVPLNKSAPAYPCGMVAYSLFNDSFQIYDSGNNNITMTTNGIAWPSDVQQYSRTDYDKMWLNISDPRFLNWIRIATLPTFRKLWARINNDLQPGTYTLTVTNNYPVSPFNSEKYFVLGTSNFFGSRNLFLSIIYLAMGALCLIIAIIFCVRKIRKDSSEDHHKQR